MVMMSPQIATTKPAPADSRTSRTGRVKPSGAPITVGSDGEAVLRLGDAHRHVAETGLLEPFQPPRHRIGTRMSAAR